MYDPNIPRWLKASVYKYFKANASGYPLHFNSYRGEKDWAELRVSGPMSEEYEYGSYQFDFEVSILVTADCSADDYAIDRIVGVFGTAADRDICCFKLGDGPMDDGSQFGVLQQYPSDKHKVTIDHFGKISAESKFKRACVESSYTMWL